MPSTSPEQEKTMRAIAHGWRPPADSKVARIPISVAQDYAKADQASPGSSNSDKRIQVARALIGSR